LIISDVMNHSDDDIYRRCCPWKHSEVIAHLFVINESTAKSITSKFQCVNRHFYSQIQF